VTLYVTKPPGKKAGKAVLYITDVFGTDPSRAKPDELQGRIELPG
jgi:hypothetical protein